MRALKNAAGSSDRFFFASVPPSSPNACSVSSLLANERAEEGCYPLIEHQRLVWPINRWFFDPSIALYGNDPGTGDDVIAAETSFHRKMETCLSKGETVLQEPTL